MRIIRAGIPNPTPMVRIDCSDPADGQNVDSALVVYSPQLSGGEIAAMDKIGIRTGILALGAVAVKVQPIKLAIGDEPIQESSRLDSTLSDPVQSIRPALEARLSGQNLDRGIEILEAAFQD